MTPSIGFARVRGGARGRTRIAVGCLMAACLVWLAIAPAHADTTLNPKLLPRIQAATFEVVAAKPEDTLRYEKPLPMDLIPYQERTDKYYSIGTAFAIGRNRYVTAGHVLMIGYNSLWGPPELRDADGKVYAIDKVEKFALRRDFVVFSLKDPPKVTPLPLDTNPSLNQVVYSVGNALGTGVVIRNGLYTSNTPEAQDGKWKWIRFSAAASPGNSGGPLLDQDGKVMGVVLMKSPNENLNYALPIRQVLDAPADVARYNKRGSYQFDALPATITGVFKGQFMLPKTLPEFFAAYTKAFHAYVDSQLTTLLQQQSAKLFPNGQGAQQILYGHPSMSDFPRMLHRNSNGVWTMTGNGETKITLAANGYVVGGTAQHDILFRVRKPDNVPERQFHHNPQAVMDLLLKTGFLKRRIGSQRVQVISLGPPAKNTTWTDRWGRHWQVWTWPIPYANGFQTVFALPTPDGYAILTRLNSAASQHDSFINLRALTDFIALAYHGTLKQWQAFLAESELLPDAFRHIHIGFGYGNDFHYASDRLRFSFTPSLQKIEPTSELTLGFTFFPDAQGKVVWGVGQVWLAAEDHDHHWVSLLRHQAPPPQLDQSYQSAWQKVLHRRHPYDAQAYTENDMTKIKAVVPAPRGGKQPSVLYTAYVYQPGSKPQGQMKQKLDLLLQNAHVPAHAASVAGQDIQ